MRSLPGDASLGQGLPRLNLFAKVRFIIFHQEGPDLTPTLTALDDRFQGLVIHVVFIPELVIIFANGNKPGKPLDFTPQHLERIDGIV